MIVSVFLVALAVFILAVALTAALAGWRAAPWVPTWQRDVRRMLRLADLKPGELVIDLGSGDGRILLTAVREFGSRALGYELSLLPYLVSRFRLALGQLGGRAEVHFADFLTADLSAADVITIFLTPEAMEKLRKKFVHGLKPGCRIVSAVFRLPDWPLLRTDQPTPRRVRLFLYRVDGG